MKKNKKLHHLTEQKHTKIIHSLSEVNKLITLTLNTRKIFSLIVNSVAKITEAKAVTLRILSEDRKKLILEANGGITKEHSQKKDIRSDEGIAGLVLKQNKPVVSSERPYRKVYSKEKVIKEIKRLAEVQFDPKIVNCLVKTMKIEKEGL